MMRIRELRKEKKWTQNELAKRIGVSRSTVAMWEVGSNEPDNKTLIDLAHLFNCSIDYLLGKTNNPIDDDLLDEVNTIPDELLEKYSNILEAKKAIYADSTPDERELLLIYRDLNDIGKSVLLGTARGLEANTEMRKDGESNTMTTA